MHNVLSQKYCAALITLGMLYVTLFFSSFVMGYKIIRIFGHIVCASVFIFPLLFPINDAITELFGVKTSYVMIVVIVLCEFLFSGLTFTLGHSPSPMSWPNQAMYPVLTAGFLHIAFADSVSLVIGFFTNTYFINSWGIKLAGRIFFVRSIGATAIGELFFTISTNFITFSLFSVTSTENTWKIILSSYTFKMIYSVIICIPNSMLVSHLKKKIPGYLSETPQPTPVRPSNVVPLRTEKLRY